ncbi:putative 2-aminoethylphosphonate ABC transporter permease subunit [Photobacterium sp. BZF1]|nr:putative 2-aminoethylphosphonate ABC transporter permease subunit [Photobacterium sp. BZF1]MBC7003079.1 putative 2-aminoethylphosphonate ABC transporter permease subunit [Photobacterium sp. BZF1]
MAPPRVQKPSRLGLKSFSRDQWVMAVLLCSVIGLMTVGLVLPLLSMLLKSVYNTSGEFVGLANYIQYLNTPALSQSLSNTLTMGVVVTLVVGILAFGYSFALTRTCMPGKTLFKALGYLPILTPSLLPGIALIYLFGNQGVAKDLLLGSSIYGPVGIVLGLVFWCFPHAMILISTGLANSDARLYEAAKVLRIPAWKTFFVVTLSNAKYGLISALIVIFTLVVCDFGVAKVIGGQYNVLATDIYKQVVGMQNFSMGAVTSAVLLIPALVAFAIDRWVRNKQQQMISTSAVPYQPEPNKLRDGAAFVWCTLISICILTVIGMAIYGSLVNFWPYNKAITLRHYDFENLTVYGWMPFYNSIKMALLAAGIGTVLTFVIAYAVEKASGMQRLRSLIHLIAMLPMAVPGLVLGLGYIFFFNDVNNPLNMIYGTMTILVVNTIVHLYTVGHLTSLTALKQLPAEIEAVAASLKISQFKAFWKVSVPVCIPAILDVFIYMFVNAMTTTSAVVFLYSTQNIVASVAVMNMADTGAMASAAAMAIMIMALAALAKVFHLIVSHFLIKHTQRWKTR